MKNPLHVRVMREREEKRKGGTEEDRLMDLKVKMASCPTRASTPQGPQIMLLLQKPTRKLATNKGFISRIERELLELNNNNKNKQSD